MRGSKAKILRKIAYRNNPVMKYANNREYRMEKSPGQHRHPVPRTVVADDERFLYQTLKGRRGSADVSILD